MKKRCFVLFKTLKGISLNRTPEAVRKYILSSFDIMKSLLYRVFLNIGHSSPVLTNLWDIRNENWEPELTNSDQVERHSLYS